MDRMVSENLCKRVQVIIYMDPVVMGYPATLQETKQGGEAIESLHLTHLFAWPLVGSDGDNISWLLDGPTPTHGDSRRVSLCGYIPIPHKLWDWVCVTTMRRSHDLFVLSTLLLTIVIFLVYSSYSASLRRHTYFDSGLEALAKTIRRAHGIEGA
jgi:hypothetical protein